MKAWRSGESRMMPRCLPWETRWVDGGAFLWMWNSKGADLGRRRRR